MTYLLLNGAHVVQFLTLANLRLGLKKVFDKVGGVFLRLDTVGLRSELLGKRSLESDGNTVDALVRDIGRETAERGPDNLILLSKKVFSLQTKVAVTGDIGENTGGGHEDASKKRRLQYNVADAL